MININGKVLDKLNENEYYLLSILLNYGKQSSPDNGVLLHRTGWGLQKLQRTKKSLISKGFIAVKAQFKDKERGRSSNKYIIKSSLVSKYNGNQLHDFNIDENKLDEIQLDEIKSHENKLDENHTDYKVLKSISIETIKLLKDSFKKEEEEKKQLLEKLQKLEAENKTLKSKVAEKRKKVAPKKEKSILENVKRPKNFTDEIWNLFALFVQMRKEIKKAYKSQTSIQTKVNSLSADIKEHGEEKVIAAINLSLEHQYQGIKVSWLKNSNNDKNHQNKSKQGNTDTQGDKNIFELFEQGINGNPFDVTESDLDFELPEQEY